MNHKLVIFSCVIFLTFFSCSIKTQNAVQVEKDSVQNQNVESIGIIIEAKTEKQIKSEDVYIIQSENSNELLLGNQYNSLLGVVVVEGYYTIITQREDIGNQKFIESSRDGLYVLKAPSYFNEYYKNLVVAGNSINELSTTNDLIIGLLLKDISKKSQEIVTSSTKEKPIQVILLKLSSKDREADTFFEIMGFRL